MPQYKIAVIRGDGIGPEVIEEGLKILDYFSKNSNIDFSFTELSWGSDYYFKNGFMMPENGIAQLLDFDSIYLGAVGHPDLQDHITLNGLLLPIRRQFDQYVCERPSVLYKGINSPLKGYKAGEIDFVVIRENTEGEYANIGGFQYFGDPNEIGIQTSLFTKRGCERVMNYAFELARKRNDKKFVTSITKSNAQGYGMVVWDRAFDNIAKNYPDIKTESLLVDAACMDFIRKPETFDVVVASNLFGDILTDIGAIITGSMGLAPSGNIDPSRNFPSMFEPVHGSAPDIVDQGVANPLAAIFSSAMMLDHLGESNFSKMIKNAVEQLIIDGNVLTKDLGGTSTTSKVGNSVVDNIKDLY